MPGNEVRILVTARDDASRTFSAVNANAERMKRGVEGSVGGVADAFGGLRVGAAVAVAAIASAGVASVNLASDLAESRNAMAQTFKDSASTIEAFAARDADAFNISKSAAFEYSAALGGIFKASGLSTSAAADMSVQMVKLAADLASFKNLSIDEALQKIRSGLVGEAEPLRTVGVLLSEAAVKAQAARMGFVEVNGALTEGQKVQARAAIISAQLADAQGDVARTSGALANQLRDARQGAEDFGAKVGTAFLPAAEKMLQVLNAVLDVANAVPTPILATALTVGGLASALAAGTVVALGAKRGLDSLALAYTTVATAARAATAAQAAQTAVTAASGAAAAGRAVSTAVSGAAGAGAASAVSGRLLALGGATSAEIQAAKFAASPIASAGGSAAGAAAGGGTVTILTRALGQLALRVNPLGIAFGVLSTAAIGAAFTMQEFAAQSRKRLADQVGRQTGQFAGEVKRASDVVAAGGQPRDLLAKLQPQLENLQAARAGLQAGLEASRSGPQNALILEGAGSAEQQIAELDAAIDRLKGTIGNIREPMDRLNAQFAATAEEALAGGRGEDIGGTAEEISKKFWETFKQRMADSADREAQAAVASQRDAINNAIIDVFQASGQKAAESFRKSFTPELLDRVNQRAADLARTLGIDLVSAMQLAIDEVGAYQAALNGLESERQRKMQELRDLFSNEGDELRGGLSTNPADFRSPDVGIDVINKLGRGEGTHFPASAFVPSSGGGGSKADPLGDAIQAIRDRFNRDLAAAFATGGDAAFRDLQAQQDQLRAEIGRTADDLMSRLGVDLPTALGLAADAVTAAADAINAAGDSTQQRFNRDLAEAFLKPKGGGLDAYNKELAKQGPLFAQIAHSAQQLMKVMGIQFPEAYSLATDVILAGVDKLKNTVQNDLQGFLGKLGARRSAIGLNAVEGFNVRPQLPAFDLGGVIPGLRGTPVPILAHAGETVLTTHRDSLRTSMQKVLGGSTFTPTYDPSYPPSLSPSMSAGSPQINITRRIDHLVIQGGDQETVVRALEQSDEPLLRQVRQRFADSR